MANCNSNFSSCCKTYNLCKVTILNNLEMKMRVYEMASCSERASIQTDGESLNASPQTFLRRKLVSYYVDVVAALAARYFWERLVKVGHQRFVTFSLEARYQSPPQSTIQKIISPSAAIVQAKFNRNGNSY